MASGKSLEPKVEPPKPQVLCRCGEVWEGPIHFTAKGELRKKLNLEEHQSTALGRLALTTKRAGSGEPLRTRPVRASRQRHILPSIATHVARRNPKTGNLERIQVVPRLGKS